MLSARSPFRAWTEGAVRLEPARKAQTRVYARQAWRYARELCRTSSGSATARLNVVELAPGLTAWGAPRYAGIGRSRDGNRPQARYRSP